MGGAFYSYKEDDEYSIGRLIGGGAFGKVYELYRFKKPCGLAIKQIGIEKSRMDHIQREVLMNLTPHVIYLFRLIL